MKPFDLIYNQAEWIQFQRKTSGEFCYLSIHHGDIWRVEYRHGTSYAERIK